MKPDNTPRYFHRQQIVMVRPKDGSEYPSDNSMIVANTVEVTVAEIEHAIGEHNLTEEVRKMTEEGVS